MPENTLEDTQVLRFLQEETPLRRCSRCHVAMYCSRACQDGEGTAKGPGLFLYTKGMPVTILFNICTPLGLVNEA
jgi:hypothetical protein